MGARRELGVEDYVRGVLAGDRGVLGRTITLIESTRQDHQATAQEVLARLLPHTGGSDRVGISGPPGAGKSTFIARFGKHLIDLGRRVAVLAVDPSSSVTGGSILGDKTRMAELAGDPSAFIRPSPSAGALGGVARRTREAMLVVEAAGFDVVLIETVGVGQSEITVAQMVDFFLMLVLAGGGDELQGIKRGILEVADLVGVTKADGDNLGPAKRAQAEYRAALRILRGDAGPWRPEVVQTSAMTGAGLDEVWRLIRAHRETLEEAGRFQRKREEQRLGWMWSQIEGSLLEAFRGHPEVTRALPELQRAVLDGSLTPTRAAERALAAFGIGPSGDGGSPNAS